MEYTKYYHCLRIYYSNLGTNNYNNYICFFFQKIEKLLSSKTFYLLLEDRKKIDKEDANRLCYTIFIHFYLQRVYIYIYSAYLYQYIYTYIYGNSQNFSFMNKLPRKTNQTNDISYVQKI